MDHMHGGKKLITTYMSERYQDFTIIERLNIVRALPIYILKISGHYIITIVIIIIILFAYIYIY